MGSIPRAKERKQKDRAHALFLYMDTVFLISYLVSGMYNTEIRLYLLRMRTLIS